LTKTKLLALLGPTAVGKTALVNNLAGRFSGVIYADSASFYRQLNIGSAKPSPAEQQLILHHFINCLNFNEQLTASNFTRQAEQLIAASKGDLLLTGGSLFYLQNLLYGSSEAPPPSEATRKYIQQRLINEGKPALYNELSRVDPISAGRLHSNDSYRVSRALEVFYDTGRPLSSFARPLKPRKDLNLTIIILERPREELYQRINERIEFMFTAGLAAEVANLKQLGATAASPAMKAIGYAEWFNPNLSSEAEIKEAIKQNTRRYAKRQLTFLRSLKPYSSCFNADDTVQIIEGIRNALL